MWKPEFSDEFDRRVKKFGKDHPRELRVVSVNANKYFQALAQGAKPKQIQGGWVHPEPMDVIAITEKGANEILGGKNKARGLIPMRLYVYPDMGTKTLHHITLGDKSTQHDDIQYCKRYVEEINSKRTRSADSG